MQRKALIIDLIQNELKRIDGSIDERAVNRGPYQYKTNLSGNVSKRFLFLDQINDPPTVCFKVGTERITHIGGGVKYGVFPVNIRGYIHNELSIETAEDLADDIEFVIDAMRLEGCSLGLVDARVLGIGTDEGLLAPYGVCDVEAQIGYEI